MSGKLPNLLPDFPDFPVFSSIPVESTRRYEYNGNWVEITPSNLGSATVQDSHVLMYLVDKYLASIETEGETSPAVKFIASELVSAIGGDAESENAYEELYNTLVRLQGTLLDTSITNDRITTQSFEKILTEFRYVTKNDRMFEGEVKFSLLLCKVIESELAVKQCRESNTVC